MDRIMSPCFKGCFESSTAHPDLEYYTGPRPDVAGGNGFEALQECARRCQELKFPFLAMNRDGCWCDKQYGTLGSFERVNDAECVDAGFSTDACGVGPCGAAPTRNAIYAVQPTPAGASTVGRVGFQPQMRVL